MRLKGKCANDVEDCEKKKNRAKIQFLSVRTRMYSDTQRTAKRGKISHATRLWLIAYFFALFTYLCNHYLYIIKDTFTVKWNLFVKYKVTLMLGVCGWILIKDPLLLY